jgi:hypothetical protein
MHPIIEQIKQECWSGKDQHPKMRILNLKADKLTVTAAGIQKQIDSFDGQLCTVFALDDGEPMRVRRYDMDKSL